jgi:hypothetical protein
MEKISISKNKIFSLILFLFLTLGVNYSNAASLGCHDEFTALANYNLMYYTGIWSPDNKGYSRIYTCPNSFGNPRFVAPYSGVYYKLNAGGYRSLGGSNTYSYDVPLSNLTDSDTGFLTYYMDDGFNDSYYFWNPQIFRTSESMFFDPAGHGNTSVSLFNLNKGKIFSQYNNNYNAYGRIVLVDPFEGRSNRVHWKIERGPRNNCYDAGCYNTYDYTKQTFYYTCLVNETNNPIIKIVETAQSGSGTTQGDTISNFKISGDLATWDYYSRSTKKTTQGSASLSACGGSTHSYVPAPPPTNLYSSCSFDGNATSFNWTTPAGYTDFILEYAPVSYFNYCTCGYGEYSTVGSCEDLGLSYLSSDYWNFWEYYDGGSLSSVCQTQLQKITGATTSVDPASSGFYTNISPNIEYEWRVKTKGTNQPDSSFSIGSPMMCVPQNPLYLDLYGETGETQWSVNYGSETYLYWNIYDSYDWNYVSDSVVASANCYIYSDYDYYPVTSNNSHVKIGPLYGNSTYTIYCDNSLNNPSVSITVNPPPVPPAPPKPTFIIQPTTPNNTGCGAKVKLNWTATSNTDYYQIFKATATNTDSNFNGIDSISTNSYTDTSVVNGNTYYYRIKACNVLDECSGYSSSSDPVVIPPSSDCDDPNLVKDIVATSTCLATQGTPPTDKVYLNKQMQWNIVGNSIPIQSNATTTWSGTSITGTISKMGSIYNKIYTTVGLKTIHATSTWTQGNINYTASCSTSTNVMLGGDVIREI